MQAPSRSPGRIPSHLLGTLLHILATLILTSFVPRLSIGSEKQVIKPDSDSVPNIVLILADDMGWTGLSCLIDDRVPTSKSDFLSDSADRRVGPAGHAILECLRAEFDVYAKQSQPVDGQEPGPIANDDARPCERPAGGSKADPTATY